MLVASPRGTAVRWSHLAGCGEVTGEASPPYYDITKGYGFRTEPSASPSEKLGEQRKDRITFVPSSLVGYSYESCGDLLVVCDISPKTPELD